MRKTWKWVLGSLAVLTLGLIILGSILLKQSEPRFAEKLIREIHTSSDGLYTLDFQDLDLNLWRGSASLRKVTLQADSTVYRQLASKQEAPAVYFSGDLEEIRISGVNLWSLLVQKKLNIGRLEVQGLRLEARQSPLENQDTTSTSNPSLYARIKDKLQQIAIQDIQTQNLDIRLIPKDTGADTLALTELAVLATDFRLNEKTEHDSTRIFYMRELSINLPEFSYDIPNSVYTASFDSLHYDSKTADAQLSRVSLAPRVSKTAYFKQDEENKALIELAWDQVTLENIHAQSLLEDQVLWVEQAKIKNGSAEFFKDKRYQKDTVWKIGEAPHQQLMKMNQAIRVDTLWISDIEIAYTQHSDKYPAEGRITFNGASGFIQNLTNDPARLSEDRFMRADLSARLMDQGRLHALFGFDMLSADGKHSYKGTLETMQAPAFNQILRPLLNFQIKSGKIERITFDMQANDRHHQGEFRFDYTNFAVDVLQAPDASGERDRKGILSFLTSKVLINDSNPDANGKYHIAQVDYQRVPEYSHFKSIWKALQDGIVECIGINPKYVPDI